MNSIATKKKPKHWIRFSDFPVFKMIDLKEDEPETTEGLTNFDWVKLQTPQWELVQERAKVLKQYKKSALSELQVAFLRKVREHKKVYAGLELARKLKVKQSKQETKDQRKEERRKEREEKARLVEIRKQRRAQDKENERFYKAQRKEEKLREREEREAAKEDRKVKKVEAKIQEESVKIEGQSALREHSQRLETLLTEVMELQRELIKLEKANDRFVRLRNDHAIEKIRLLERIKKLETGRSI